MVGTVSELNDCIIMKSCIRRNTISTSSLKFQAGIDKIVEQKTGIAQRMLFHSFYSAIRSSKETLSVVTTDYKELVTGKLYRTDGKVRCI